MSRTPSSPKLEVLFEDRHLIVVNKPAGMLTVPAPRPGAATLADQVRRRLLAAKEESFPVHRLDRDTSGVVLFAKHRNILDALVEQFRDRAVSKTYQAVVHGAPRPPRGRVKSYITDQGSSAKSSRTPSRNGKEAITEYRPLESFHHATWIEAKPLTGRLNQIRLHMVDVGAPLVGERKYAVASRFRLKFKRPLLHATRLTFVHPITRARIDVAADLPADFVEFLEQLRRQVKS